MHARYQRRCCVYDTLIHAWCRHCHCAQLSSSASVQPLQPTHFIATGTCVNKQCDSLSKASNEYFKLAIIDTLAFRCHNQLQLNAPCRTVGNSVIGPILWGHSGPLCHALSLLSLSSLLWTSMRRRRATVSIPGEWQCKTGGVRRLAVANGPNIFQMLLVLIVGF